MTSTREVGRSERGRLRSPSVVTLIKEYILDNRLAPGDAMPTESELSEELGVSRSRIRESIKTLSALDIVEVRHGYGTYVGRMSLSALVESLAFRGTLLSPDDSSVIADLVDIREMLESGLATSTIEGATAEQLAELRGLTDEMTTLAAQGDEFFAQDRAFHLILMAPTGNQLAVQLTGAFWDVHSIVTSTIAPVSDLVKTAEAHVEIVDAVEARDEARLRRAISHHYDPIRQRIGSPPR
jgi:DNA-binding FadR family transcriptional regulator